MPIKLDFTALDIETTGFKRDVNEIIEIGATKFVQNEITETFSIFIKPVGIVPEFIKQLTHITDEQLAGGESLTEALLKMKEFVGTDTLVCHNADFDIGFLNAKLNSIGLENLGNPVLDTLQLSFIYLPFTTDHKLGTIAEYFNIDLSKAHRAFYDAEATGKILVNLLDFIDVNISLQINHQLREIALISHFGDDLADFLGKIEDHQKKHALLTKTKPQIHFHNRNYIENEPADKQQYSVRDIFDKGGVFDKSFANYEVREGQIDMAEEVLQSFTNEEYLLVEAGTGVGKSLAYIIPSLIYTNHEKSKVIISTNTKNLQEQLFYKDLPAVTENIALPFKATLLKGRRNYICERKWAEFTLDYAKMLSPYDAKDALKLVVWKHFTKTGDISENTSFNTNMRSWKIFVSERHSCRGRRCSHYKNCYLMDIRKKAEKSNIVVINHHLLLSDMLSENAALGEYDKLIVDEAHNLPKIAPEELGLSLSYPEMNNFLSFIFTDKRKFRAGVLTNLKASLKKSSFDETKKDALLSQIEKASELILEKREILGDFFSRIADVTDKKGSWNKLRIRNIEDFPFITSFLSELIFFMEKLSKHFVDIRGIMATVSGDVFVNHSENLDAVESVQMRIAEYHGALSRVYNPDLKDNAMWMEVFNTFGSKDKNYPRGVLNYAPLSVEKEFMNLLYEKTKSVVFTSATLALRGVFKYFSSKMGLHLLEEGFVQERVVSSPFDYEKQSMAVAVGFLPEPRDKFYLSQASEVIKQVLEISRTGTMILFTSYKDLNAVYDELYKPLKQEGIPLLAQGKGMSRTMMMSEFKNKKNAVMLGTSSFWEGVDIPGESLSLLILYKLPFMVPTDPIVEAQIEKLDAEEKNSFMHYMVPTALLKYRQGFGRLIRNKTDKGVVLVLDSRIHTKKYGQYFKEIIPAKTKTAMNDSELYDHIARWFKGI